MRLNGAVDQTNLETDPVLSILEELEEWDAYLKAEPEVIHKLKAFEASAREADKTVADRQALPSRPRGPSL